MEKPKVLIVEDDAITAGHLQSTLEGMGYAVSGMAASGEDALAQALSEPPDVVLMDIRIRGELTGIQVVQQLHAQVEVPVIYLTAYTEESLLEAAFITQPYGYLVKPVRDRELRASIETALYKADADRKLTHLNLVLRAIRNINQLITRERQPQILLEQACQILVQTRGYKMVWIGQTQPGYKQIIPAAHAGEGVEYLDSVAIAGDESETGPGINGIALQIRQTTVFQDIATDPRASSWREAALERGLACAAAVPMQYEERLFGVLCVYTDRPNAFDNQEVELLEELTNDLAFALQSIEEDAARILAVEKIQQQKDDLALMNNLERAANLGTGLPEIFKILSDETARMFSCNGVTVYLLNQDQLEMQNLNLPTEMQTRIKAVIGRNIPSIRLPLSEGSLYQAVLQTGKPRLVSDPQIIQQIMLEFSEIIQLPKLGPQVAQKIIQQIYRLLKIQSVIVLPLIAEGKPLGIIDISSPRAFSESDLSRLVVISEQVAGVVKRRQSEQTLVERLKERSCLYAVSRDAQEELCLEEFCLRVMDRLVEAMQYPELAAPVIELGGQRFVHSKYQQGRSHFLSAEIKARGQNCGQIWVYQSEGKPFLLPEEDDLVKAIAEILGMWYERKQSEDLLSLRVGLMEFASTHSLEELLQRTLDEVEHITDSMISFYHHVEADQRTLSLQAWSTRTIEQLCTARAKELHYDIDQAGVWVDAVRQRHPVIHNDYASLPHRKGFPEGHAQVVRQLVVPILRGNRIVAVLGVGNKPRDYTQHDVVLVSYLADIAWEIAENKKAQEEINRRAAEFASLYDTARDLAEQTDLQTLLQTIIQRAASLLGTMSSGFYLFDPKRSDLELAATMVPGISIGIRLKLDEGAAGRTARTRQPLVIQDYHTWEGRSPQYEGIQFTSVVQAPMIYQGELIGVITVENFAAEDSVSVEREFSEEDVRLLSLFASQAASAVYNARLLDETRQRLNELEVLYESGLSFSQLLQPHQIGEKIIQIIAQRLEWHHVAIRLYHPDQETLQLLAFNQPGIEDERQRQSVAEHFQKSVSRVDQGLSGWAIQCGKAIRCADVTQDPHYVETYPGIRSGLHVPLKIGERILGVISVESEEEDAFSESDERLLTTLMNQAAIALENGSLYENAQLRLHRAHALRSVDMAIASSLDLNLTINIILEHVLAELEVDAADILLLQAQSQSLEFTAGKGFHTQALQRTSLPMGSGYAGLAALEKRLVHIPDLRNRWTDFLRSPHFSSEDFVSYYAIPLIAKGNVKGVLEIFKRSLIQADQEWLDFMESLAGQVAIAIDNLSLFNDLQQSNAELSLAYEATIEGWSRALDLRDRETEGHTQRVTQMTLKLARQIGLKEEEILHVHRGALLHDIGKMGVPDSILLKPGSLTEQEWVLMRKHPILAFEMLSPIDYLKSALDIPYCHHEKWDGTGYPRGLKGEQIPLAARIFAVADVYDALTSDRPYRPAWTEKQALEHIHQQDGKHFDPEVVKEFFRLL